MYTNLYYTPETFTQGYSTVILDTLSLIAIMLAILVIASKNPVFSILFLIGLFLDISLYLIFTGLTFIGLAYLLVYVGAVSILFLFILMLINVRVSELSSETRNSIPLVVIVTGSLITILQNNLSYSNISKENYLNLLFGNSWDSQVQGTTHITAIGNILYSSHSVWLILTSIILLLAMVGAIVITLKPKKDIEENYLNTIENNILKSLVALSTFNLKKDKKADADIKNNNAD